MKPDRNQLAAERGAEQRARLIAAATDAYAAKGYHDMSIDDITAIAKMSRRTVYAHFSTIDDLRFAVLESALQQTLLVTVTTVMNAAPPDRLRRVLEVYFGQIVEKPKLARVVIYEVRRPDARNTELRRRIFDFFVRAWVDGQAEDVAKGWTPRSLDEPTAYAFLGAIEGMAVHYLERHEEARALEAVPVLLDLVRAMHPFHLPSSA